MGNKPVTESERFAQEKKSTLRKIRDKKNKYDYAGEVYKGKKHGFGVEVHLTELGHTIYIGYFKNGAKYGYGRIDFYNQDEYTGFWINNSMFGSGRLKYGEEKPEIYNGQLNNNAINGFGVFEFMDNSKYEGFWKDNRKEGIGHYSSDGDKWIYRGEFAGDCMSGYGIYEREMKKKLMGEHRGKEFKFMYEGMFQGDKKTGNGIETFTFDKNNEKIVGYRFVEKKQTKMQALASQMVGMSKEEGKETFSYVGRILYEEGDKFWMVSPPDAGSSMKDVNVPKLPHKTLMKQKEAADRINLIKKYLKTNFKNTDLDPPFAVGNREYEIVDVLNKKNGVFYYMIQDANSLNAVNSYFMKSFLCNTLEELEYNYFEYEVLLKLNNKGVVPKIIDLPGRNYFIVNYNNIERHNQALHLERIEGTPVKLCFIMEYMENMNFLSELMYSYPFSSRDIVVLGLKILEAFSVIEEAGIFHGQIYPHHIYCSKFEDVSQCQVKIIDFSQANWVSNNRVYNRYRAVIDETFRKEIIEGNPKGLECGNIGSIDNLLYQFVHPFGEYSKRTIKYMSPSLRAYYDRVLDQPDVIEVYNIKESDVYSLGCVLFRLFATKSPSPYIEDDFMALGDPGRADEMIRKIREPILTVDERVGPFMDICIDMIRGDIKSITEAFAKFNHSYKTLDRPLSNVRDVPRTSTTWRVSAARYIQQKNLKQIQARQTRVQWKTQETERKELYEKPHEEIIQQRKSVMGSQITSKLKQGKEKEKNMRDTALSIPAFDKEEEDKEDVESKNSSEDEKEEEEDAEEDDEDEEEEDEEEEEDDDEDDDDDDDEDDDDEDEEGDSDPGETPKIREQALEFNLDNEDDDDEEVKKPNNDSDIRIKNLVTYKEKERALHPENSEKKGLVGNSFKSGIPRTNSNHGEYKV